MESDLRPRPTRFRLAAVPVAAVLVATLVAWFAEEAILRAIDKAREANAANPSPQIMRGAAADTTITLKSVTVYGSAGLMLGLALGLAGGHAAGSTAALVRGGLVGFLVGAAVGAGIGYVTAVLFAQFFDARSPTNLAVVLAVRCIAAAGLGASGGLAFGIARGAIRPTAAATLSGLAGAVVGAVGGELLNALVFFNAPADQAYPSTQATRLIFLVLVAVLTALGTVWGLQRQLAPAKPAP